MIPRPTRVSLFRFSPALILLAIVIADLRQAADPDLWGHVLWGRELLAHGSLPNINPYSYSAAGYPWLRHEWLSEVLMGSMFDKFGPLGLKLLKFACSAATISFIVLAESETAASAILQAAILLVVALILFPLMSYRPQLFDYVLLSAIIALLARHSRRGSAPLWIAIPIVAVWANFHAGFFVGIIALGVYGATTLLCDLLAGRGPRRGVGIVAIALAAAASTLCTLLIPPARDTWHSLISELLNPRTRSQVADWRPLIAAVTAESIGSAAQRYFILVLLFFAAAAAAVVVTPRGDDAPLVGVAAVMVAAAFTALRNIPFAAIAIAPVIVNHLGLRLQTQDIRHPPATSAKRTPRAARLAVEILVAVFAIVIARSDGVLSQDIDAVGSPVAAISFMKSHRLTGNVLTTFDWGQYVIWHGAPGMKVFIDSRYDEGYPAAVIRDYLELQNGTAGASHTLAAYPHDFVLIENASAAAKLMDSRPDWRLIYSDNVARLYAPANSPAAHLDGVPFKGIQGHVWFP
jgi:hypothetical protein